MPREKTEILPRATALFPKSAGLVRVYMAYHPDRDAGSGEHQDGWERVEPVYATRAEVEALAARGFTKVSMQAAGRNSPQDAAIAGLLARW